MYYFLVEEPENSTFSPEQGVASSVESFSDIPDVRTFDGRPWQGRVDAVCGGFPYQDIAVGSSTASGLSGERSGLWREMLRVICEIRPSYVLVENFPALVVRGLESVLSGMAQAGYDARWGVFSGRNVHAPIERERIFIAGTNKEHRETRLGYIQNKGEIQQGVRRQCPDFWLQAPSKCFGVEHGMDSYMDSG